MKALRARLLSTVCRDILVTHQLATIAREIAVKRARQAALIAAAGK